MVDLSDFEKKKIIIREYKWDIEMAHFRVEKARILVEEVAQKIKDGKHSVELLDKFLCLWINYQKEKKSKNDLINHLFENAVRVYDARHGLCSMV